MKSMAKITAFLLCLCALVAFGCISAEADGEETAPPEYSDFLDSIDGSVSDKLPDGVFSDRQDEINQAAGELADPINILNAVSDAFGAGIREVAPTLALVLGIVILSAVMNVFASASPSLSRVAEGCTRLCTFTAISGIAVSCVSSLSIYFERLFGAVASFVPLSAVLYAMGGNLTGAASNSTVLGIMLSVCQFFCTKTVIPVFCICLCLCLLSVFGGTCTGGAVSGAIRKWYTTALAFIMMLLTVSLGGSSLLSAKADNMAMRGMKFAVSNFIPVSGGTVSSTLGTLAASVELLRSSIGVIGIVVIALMLLPTIIELALMRGVFAIGSFCASTLGCSGEARLLSELDSLYGYLEGIAALTSAVFVIALGIFAAASTPFG